MILTDGQSQLELELLEVEQYPAGLGDKRCYLMVKTGNFWGSDDAIWFRDGICQQFVQELKKLEQTRQGKATLTSMSHEFCLILEVYHALGRVAVSGYLKSSLIGVRSRLTNQLNFDFDLEPEYIIQTVALFEQLLG